MRCSCWGLPGDMRVRTTSANRQRRCLRFSGRTEAGHSCRRSRQTHTRRDRHLSRYRPPVTPFRARSINEELRSFCERSFPTGRGSSALVRFRCKCRRTADFLTDRTSGSRPPARAGRRWRSCWRCRCRSRQMRLLVRELPADPTDGLGRYAQVRRQHPLRDPGCD